VRKNGNKQQNILGSTPDQTGLMAEVVSCDVREEVHEETAVEKR
jgi:hypothetical protein